MKNLKIAIVGSVLLFGLFGCKKTCGDSEAKNYDSSSNKKQNCEYYNEVTLSRMIITGTTFKDSEQYKITILDYYRDTLNIDINYYFDYKIITYPYPSLIVASNSEIIVSISTINDSLVDSYQINLDGIKNDYRAESKSTHSFKGLNTFLKWDMQFR